MIWKKSDLGSIFFFKFIVDLPCFRYIAKWLFNDIYMYIYTHIHICGTQTHTHTHTHTLPWWLRWYRICLQCKKPRFDPWVRKIPWRRKWQPTPVSLPGKSHGQRSLAGYSPWGHKQLDTTERLTLKHMHTQIYAYIFFRFPIIGYYQILNIVSCAIQ